MEREVQVFVAILLLVVGGSHVLQSRAWSEFFSVLSARGVTGNFVNALLSLGTGGFIVAFHQVYDGVPLLLTVYGWLSLAKAALYFLAPGIGLRSIKKASEKDPRLFVVPGIVLVALGAVLLAYPSL